MTMNERVAPIILILSEPGWCKPEQVMGEAHSGVDFLNNE
jgi:hypothetical protein